MLERNIMPMKRIFQISFILTLLFLPLIVFSAVRIGITIPIFTGPSGPPVYIPATMVPAGTWENVSLNGVIVAASGNTVTVRTPEGIQHNVYFTSQTVVQGRLIYGVPVTVQAQLANGALYATMISVTGGPAPGTYQPPSTETTNAPLPTDNSYATGPPPAPMTVPPPPPNGRAFYGAVVQTNPDSIMIQLASGKTKRIMTNPQTQVYGPLTAGTPVIINAVKVNGKWLAQAVYVSPPPSAYGNATTPPPAPGTPYPNPVYIPYPAPYPYPYPVTIYAGYVWPHVYIYGHWGWSSGWHWGSWNGSHGGWHGGGRHGHGH